MSTRITDSSDESYNPWLDNKKNQKTLMIGVLDIHYGANKGENKYITDIGK